MADLRADTKIGCDPFPVGEDEAGTVQLMEEIDTGDLGDERIAFVTKINGEEGVDVYLAQSWVRIGGSLTRVVIATTTSADSALLTTMAEPDYFRSLEKWTTTPGWTTGRGGGAPAVPRGRGGLPGPGRRG